MAGLLIWALVGMILNAALASKKGHSIFAWLFLGFFFGFLSTLVLALLPKKIDGKTFKKCTYCAETIKAEASVCRYCSKEVELKPLDEELKTEVKTQDSVVEKLA